MMRNDTGIPRKTALITGASSGIGYELTKLFARDDFDLVLVVHATAAHSMMKMVESHPQGWSQGRCFFSADSLCVSLTWMPSGTFICDHRRMSGSTHVRFSSNRHLTSLRIGVLSFGRLAMQLVHARCAGLDVHKKSVVAAVRLLNADGSLTTQVRSFATTTSALLDLVAWLLSLQVTHVAMESTGEFWKPIYNLLEGNFTVLVVNAAHIKYVPGRKTDIKDAEWIAELLAHGLLRPSFVPPAPQRALRDLTRQRTHLIQERASVVNRLQKVLEWANIKLASVVTDISGVSARAMLEALVAGESDVTALANLAKGRLRTKQAELEQALRGRLQPHHAFMITQHLALIDVFDEQIAAFDARIDEAIEQTKPGPPPADRASGEGEEPGTDQQPSAPNGAWAAQTIVDAIPGIGERIAETIVAELGVDMSRFPSQAHVSSWAGLAPGQHESAGKRKSTRIRDGNKYLRSALIQAAWAAVKQSESSLASFYRGVAARRGKKKAIVALAHKILVIIYTLLKSGQLYQERGAAALDEHQKERLLARMQRRLEKLGYKVALEPILATATT
jgi:transposase